MTMLISGHARGANTGNILSNTATDLSVGSNYLLMILPTSAATTDLQFSGTYTGGTTLTIKGATLSFGTLNDLNTTQNLVISNSSAVPGSLILNSAANSTAGANASDLLYVASGGNLTIQSGTGTLTLGLAVSGNIDNAGTLTISAPLSIAASTTTTFTGKGATTVSGNIAALLGSVAVNAAGGSVTLSGANTYTGLTTVNNGTLILGSNTALGNGGLIQGIGTGGTIIGSGGTVDLNGQTGVNEVFTLNGTGVGNNGALINGSATASTIASGVSSINVSGTPTGLNANTTVSIGAPTSGTTATASAVLGVTSSTFNISSGAATYLIAPTVTISGGGGTGATAVANLNLGSVTSITITNPGTGFTSVPTITFSGGTFILALSQPTGSGVDGHFMLDGVAVTNNGSGYTTTPIISLSSGSVTTTANLSSVNLASNASVGGTGNITINPVISGSATGLTKVGADTVTLGSAATYTGGTVISGGTLEVDGSLSSSSNVTIGGASGSATPTLTGSGTVNGAVTVSSASGGAAGTINPGGVGTIGTLTVGSISFQNGGDLSLDLSGANTDLLAITHAATIATGAGIKVAASALTLGDYILATAASGLNSASFTVVGSLPSGYKLVQSSTELDLQHLADQTLTSTSAASISIILGSSTPVGAILSNIVPVGSTFLNVNLSDAGGTGGVVSGLTSSAGTTIAGGATSTIGGTLTATTAGLGETWGIKNTDLGAITTSLTVNGTLNVYNHSTPTLTITSGNNQSSIVGGALTAATLTLADTTGTYPAPLDVNTLVNLTGTTGSGVIATGGTGLYTAPALNTSIAGTGQTLNVSLKAGDQQTIIGASPLSTLSATFSYNVYNHATPTLTIGSGNNQSVFVNGTLGSATLTLADTTGTVPAPLDVNTLSNLTGLTGSGVIGSGSTGTYTATGFNTIVAGIGKTLSLSLKAGDQQTITGASALSTLNQTLTYNVYNHATPTLTITTGNNQSGIVGSTLANATLTLADTGTSSAPLDVGSLSNLTGTTGSGVVGSGTFAGTINSATGGVVTGSFNLAVTTLENAGLGLLGEGTYNPVNVGYTAFVYTGQGVWNASGSGSWGTVAMPANWTADGGTPGLDPNFASSDTATFGNSIGAAHATVTLDGDNPSLNAVTFSNTTGGTYIIAQGTGGTLKLNGGAGSATITNASGANTITAPMELDTNGVISVAGGTVVDLVGTIGESGAPRSLTMNGDGLLQLNGANTYSGGTTIASGALMAGGPTAFGAGDVTMTGGVLEVGNGTHEIDVAHNYTQTGGTLVLNLSGTMAGTANGYQFLHVPGTATLGGALEVVVQPVYVPVNGDTFTFVQAGTIMGGFTSETSNLSALSITPRGVGTIVINQLPFATLPGVPYDPNQSSVATDIDNTYSQGTAKLPLQELIGALDGLTGQGNSSMALPQAFDQLNTGKFHNFVRETVFNDVTFSTQMLDGFLEGRRWYQGGFIPGNGEIDASNLTVNDPSVDPSLAQVSSHLLAWNPAPQRGLLDDSSQAIPDGFEVIAPTPSEPERNLNLFVAGNVILAQGFSQPDLSHFNSTAGGVQLGACYRLAPHLETGTFFSYSHADGDLDNLGSKATIDSYAPGIFLSFADHGWYANAIGSYGFDDFTEDRAISIGGLTGTSRGTPSGNELIGSLDGGYDFQVNKWTCGPIAGLQYTNLTIDGFTENGFDSTDLQVDRAETSSLRSRLGGHITHPFRVKKVVLTPHLDAFWQHEFLDGGQTINAQFTSIGTGSFGITTPRSSRDSALIDAGLNADLNGQVTLYLDYQLQAAQNNYFGQSVQAGVKIGF